MPKFVFTSPEGKRYEITGPEGATQEQAWQQLQQQLGQQPTGPTGPTEPTEPPPDPALGSRKYQFGRGVAQGAIFDPIEGIGQLIEHAAGMKIPMPQAVRKWLKDVRDRTEATTTGKVGRVAGAVGSLAIAPEVAAGARVANIGYRAARMTGPELVNLAQRLGRPETLRRVNAYAGAVGKTGNRLTNEEVAEALLGHVPGQPWRTLGAPARVGVAAGTAAAEPVEGKPENYWAEKGYQAATGGALGGLAGSAVARGAARAFRPSTMHYAHLPFTGYGAYHLLGPYGMATAGGTLATLAALAKGGGVRSLTGLGGMAGEAVRSLYREEPNAEADTETETQ